MAPNILSIFGSIGKGILKGADIGAKAGIPIASQIDKVADTIKDIKGKRKIDEAAIADVVTAIQELKTAVPEVTKSPKASLESNRFKMVLVGLGVSVLVSWGLPEDIAKQTMDVVFYLVSAYVLGDTLRPSTKNKPAE